MTSSTSRLLILSLSIATLVACANKPCRELRQPNRDETVSATAPGGATGSSAPAPFATPATLRTQATGASSGGPVSTSNPTPGSGTNTSGTPVVQQKSGSLFVFKADGSLQCGMGKAISLEDMEKELKGIKVLSRDKRPDGMMHIQVCGSPTGIINIYEIPAANLADAESRGFKKLERP